MSSGNKKVPRKQPTYTSQSCMAVRGVLSLVGNKWSMLIIVILRDGPHRFNELRHSIEGISQRMLTLTLRELERDGLLTRTVEPTIPLSVHYDLTPLGQTLLEPVLALTSWAQTNHPQILLAQEKFDATLNK